MVKVLLRKKVQLNTIVYTSTYQTLLRLETLLRLAQGSSVTSTIMEFSLELTNNYVNTAIGETEQRKEKAAALGI